MPARHEHHRQRQRQVVDLQRPRHDRLLASHCQIDQPGGDRERDERQHRHDLRAHEARARRPASSTMQAPPVSATSGESAAQSMSGR